MSSPTAKIINQDVNQSPNKEEVEKDEQPNEFICNVIDAIQNFSNMPGSYKKWLNDYFRKKINSYFSTICREFKIEKMSKNL